MSDAVAPAESLQDRIALAGRGLREHTARGTLVNAAFNVGLAGLALARNMLVAVFLTTEEYGLWGLIFVSLTTLLWLKDIGLTDKFVQQSSADQERAFQRAFTVNLIWTLAFFVLLLVSLPVYALVYGRPEMILPGAVLTLAVVGTAFQAPLWIYYRRMEFVRERILFAVEPVTSFVVTVGLGVAGAGIWALVLGGVVGYSVGGLVATLMSPYRLKIVYDRGALREYWSFSWPLLVASGSGVIVVQTAVIVGEGTVGLAGVGAIGLASTIGRFAERVDQILTHTIYPAICAVRDRKDLLFESFVKSNRLALMWGVPFGVGLVLFAPDLVEFVLGEKWELATGLIQVFGGLAAASQIAFNWSAYFRAVGDTRPMAVSGVAMLATFMAVGVPLTITEGLTGYAIGMIAMTAVDLCLRGVYLTRLFSAFALLRHGARAIAPALPATAVVLVARALETGERTAALAAGELVLYAAVFAVATWIAERELLREVFGYLGASRHASQTA